MFKLRKCFIMVFLLLLLSGSANAVQAATSYGGFEVEEQIIHILSFAGGGYGMFSEVDHGPHAIHVGNKTFIAIHGSGGIMQAAIFYNNNYTMSPVVTVGSTWTAIESSPTILRDNYGYLHIFSWSGGPAGIHHFKSNNIDDISAWTNVGTFWNDTADSAVETGGPVLKNNGEIIMFNGDGTDGGKGYRADSYMNSTNNGTTWSAPQRFIQSGGAWGWLQAPYKDPIFTDRVHLVWVGYDDTNGFTGIYYGMFNLTTYHLYNASGYDMGTSIPNARNASLSVSVNWFETGKTITVRSDEKGYPHIIYNAGANGTSGISKFYYTAWNGTSWIPRQLITSIDAGSDAFQSAPALNYISSTDMVAYLDRNRGTIEKWTFNGTSWIYANTLLTENDLFAPQLVSNDTSGTLLISTHNGTSGWIVNEEITAGYMGDNTTLTGTVTNGTSRTSGATVNADINSTPNSPAGTSAIIAASGSIVSNSSVATGGATVETAIKSYYRGMILPLVQRIYLVQQIVGVILYGVIHQLQHSSYSH